MNFVFGILIGLGIFTIGLCATLPVVLPNPVAALPSALVLVASVVSMLITFILTRKWIETRYEERIKKLKDETDVRVRRLKVEHDTTTLEKTIRDGTQTLIKNALDYFKIENIKNEVGSTAAIENLQLDKYGQIIELLADFSLILPDVQENQRIVEGEISHQIDIYRGDEMPFATFLERIMQKYTVTVNKKIKEKVAQESYDSRKACPQCAEKVLPQAKVCKHCGYHFPEFSRSAAHQAIAADRVEKGRQLYNNGDLEGALKEFDTAIDLKANYATAFYNRAIVYNKLGRKKEAEADLQEASYLGHLKSQRLLQTKKAG